MRKITSLALAICVLLLLNACGRSPDSPTHNGDILNESYSYNNFTENDYGGTSPIINDANTERPMCQTHNYVDNVCSVCNCSLWSGNIDTSWYSVIDLEFTISTAEQFAGLIEIANSGTSLENVKITLASSLDMNGKAVAPIGHFSGMFDGDHYYISNIVIDTQSCSSRANTVSDYTNYVGLFGYSDGLISNLDLQNITIDIDVEQYISNYIGGLVAYSDGDVENCSVQGNISVNTVGDLCVGGIAGEINGHVQACSSDVSINAHSTVSRSFEELHIGGLCGRCNDNAVSACFSIGTVSLTMLKNTQENSEAYEAYIGGLVGLSSGAAVANCYASVNVNASGSSLYAHAGGLLGTLQRGNVSSCYSTGNVSMDCSHSGDAAALIGEIETGFFPDVMRTIFVKDCFAVGNVQCNSADGFNGYANTIGACTRDDIVTNCFYRSDMVITGDQVGKNGTPAGQADLTNIAFYTNRLLWNTEIWNIADGIYPTLQTIAVR